MRNHILLFFIILIIRPILSTQCSLQLAQLKQYADERGINLWYGDCSCDMSDPFRYPLDRQGNRGVVMSDQKYERVRECQASDMSSFLMVSVGGTLPSQSSDDDDVILVNDMMFTVIIRDESNKADLAFFNLLCACHEIQRLVLVNADTLSHHVLKNMHELSSLLFFESEGSLSSCVLQAIDYAPCLKGLYCAGSLTDNLNYELSIPATLEHLSLNFYASTHRSVAIKPQSYRSMRDHVSTGNSLSLKTLAISHFMAASLDLDPSLGSCLKVLKLNRGIINEVPLSLLKILPTFSSLETFEWCHHLGSTIPFYNNLTLPPSTRNFIVPSFSPQDDLQSISRRHPNLIISRYGDES